MKGIPSSMEKKAAEELYKNIRKAMNIKEGWNLWQIAPKLIGKDCVKTTLVKRYIKLVN